MSERPNRPVVLVAEDDASVRMTIELVLDDEGFEVLMAKNGEEALSLAQSALPDVILLDHVMPKMGGKDVLAALRRDESTAAIPVLVLTGMARDDADWPGAQFVGKPFSPDELVARIRDVIPST
ncbi:MAG TPA: response regulator [Actinomycetota bacterium]|nr:response regulator [Actinomycetota bacterium]